MSMYKFLRRTQRDHGGPLACAMACCHLAYGCLTDVELQNVDLLTNEGLALVDRYIEQGCAEWRETCNHSELYPKEAIEKSSLLSGKLELANEIPTILGETEHSDDQGNAILKTTSSELYSWLRNPAITCCLVTRNGFTFLVVPMLPPRGHYTVIDTHVSSPALMNGAMSKLSLPIIKPEEKGRGGLVWTTIFIEEVINFVELYCGKATHTDPIQIDLNIVRLKQTVE